MIWEKLIVFFKWKTKAAKSYRNSDLNCEYKYIKPFLIWREKYQNIYSNYRDIITDFAFFVIF